MRALKTSESTTHRLSRGGVAVMLWLVFP